VEEIYIYIRRQRQKTYCCGDIDPKVVAESVNGELLFVDCEEEGGKKGPPLKVK
jgi:hypothetical protein